MCCGMSCGARGRMGSNDGETCGEYQRLSVGCSGDAEFYIPWGTITSEIADKSDVHPLTRATIAAARPQRDLEAEISRVKKKTEMWRSLGFTVYRDGVAVDEPHLGTRVHLIQIVVAVHQHLGMAGNSHRARRVCPQVSVGRNYHFVACTQPRRRRKEHRHCTWIDICHSRRTNARSVPTDSARRGSG